MNGCSASGCGLAFDLSLSLRAGAGRSVRSAPACRCAREYEEVFGDCPYAAPLTKIVQFVVVLLRKKSERTSGFNTSRDREWVRQRLANLDAELQSESGQYGGQTS